MYERELSVLDSQESGERISVIEVSSAGEDAFIELRFEQEVGNLGWVTQRRMRIESSQVGDLRLALTLFASSHPKVASQPRLVSFADYSEKIA